MTYVKLEDAIKAVKAIEVPVGGFDDKIDAWVKAIDIAADALASLPTVSDGWEDIAEAARYYMSQIGQGYEAHKLPMGPTQIEADRRLRAALAALGPLPAPPSE